MPWCHGWCHGVVLRSRSCPSLLLPSCSRVVGVVHVIQNGVPKKVGRRPTAAALQLSRGELLCCFRRRAPLSPNPVPERGPMLPDAHKMSPLAARTPPLAALSLSSRSRSLAPSLPRPLAPSLPRPHPRVLASIGGGYSRGPAADPPPSMRSPHSPAVRHVRSLPETVAGKRRGP